MALTDKRWPSPLRYIFEYIAQKRSMAEAVTGTFSPQRNCRTMPVGERGS
ncbi:MAG: hypothetical protein WCA26_12155 [Xanthobacteraceae bacterium]|jgi:hypothetical protein